MTVHAFTSFSLSYLNRARVLAKTLARQHPDWTLWAVLTDRDPPEFAFDPKKHGFHKVLYVEDLLGAEAEHWLFSHDVVEACTAVKGEALKQILAQPDADKVFYFDPDIAVFNSMEPVEKLLDSYSIVLTPHQLEPDDMANKRAILDNEITSLGFGVFNLGFVAVNDDAEGRRFAQWWADRLHDWCHDRRDLGIFVDQKWCDLVPCFFENFKVLRDPGYNVASWNLSQRHITFDEEGAARANGKLLRFYHFTKLGAIGDMMTQRYAADNIEVYEVWRWYQNQVTSETDPAIPNRWWYYGRFDNGIDVPKSVRCLFRERQDLRDAFQRPFNVDNGFFSWLESNNFV